MNLERKFMDNKILPKVFGWMVVGLIITFFTGFMVSTNENMLINIFSNFGMIVLLILEIGIVVFLSSRITKMSATTARISFLLYSFISGLFFSIYFIEFEVTSLIYVFLIAAVVFALFALIGAKTKLDLSKISTYLFMGLIALIICTIINIFLNNTSFDFIISVIGILLFIGYVAYDIQVILRSHDLDAIPEENLAIYGALQLYLDFINIFIDLLNIIGKNRNN